MLPTPTSTQVAVAVNPFQQDFVSAAAYSDVPLDWAINQALLLLVHRESSFNPEAQNPISTARGLFQLLRGTWDQFVPEVAHEAANPFWQAVGGFRYIRTSYRTPERALAFWESTAARDPSRAPTDLQTKAQFWIDRGYVGY